MRSLKLLVVFFALLIVQPIKAASPNLIPAEFFNISVPFEANTKTTTEQRVKQVSQQAMELLLLRLTGQKRLTESPLGQRYISNANSWLANYNIKPRYEDGVIVGKNLQLQFDANRIKKSLTEQNVKLWASALRPKTMVMGVFVQQGRLQKLTDEKLNYRIDVDYRVHPTNLRLPFAVAETEKNWVFPVDPVNSRSTIQEVLLAAEQQNLLSFKMTSKANQSYELSWYLFNLAGSTLKQGLATGQDRQKLLKNMFVEMMQVYAKQTSAATVAKNQLLVNINQVSSGDLVNLLEAEIAAQQPLVRSARVVMLEAGRVQIQVEYQGDVQNMVNWLKNWRRVIFIGQPEENIVDVSVHSGLNRTGLVKIEPRSVKETKLNKTSSDNNQLTPQRAVIR